MKEKIPTMKQITKQIQKTLYYWKKIRKDVQKTKKITISQNNKVLEFDELQTLFMCDMIIQYLKIILILIKDERSNTNFTNLQRSRND